MGDKHEVRVRPQTVFSVHHHHPFPSDLNREIASGLSIGQAGEIAFAMARARTAEGLEVDIYGCNRSMSVVRLDAVQGAFIDKVLATLAEAPMGSTVEFESTKPNDNGDQFLKVTFNTLHKGVL